MKYLVWLIFCICTVSRAEATPGEKPEIQLSAGQGFGLSSSVGGETLTQIQVARLHPVLRDLAPFQIGYGVRYSHFGADSILSRQYSAGAINLGVHASYLGLDWIDLGMNIDVFGIATGSDVGHRTNLLRGGKNDLGFLNSEFFIMRRLPHSTFVRMAFMHVASGVQPQTFVDLIGLSIGMIW